MGEYGKGNYCLKNLKILAGALVISIITSTFGVFAYVSTPLRFSYSVPPYNGGVNTAQRTKANLGVNQTITAVTVTPSTDTLDVILKQGNGSDGSPWKILKTNTTTTFNNSVALINGMNYYLRIDSRWYYTNTTPVSGTWSVN